jgi:hypothetical protein
VKKGNRESFNENQGSEKDMHWRISRNFVQEHKHVLISRFQISDIFKRKSRKIQSEKVRKMLQ